MQNTYYKIPNINISKDEIKKAIGITKFNFFEYDNFKSKIYAKDIPEECQSLIKLRETGLMHSVFTCISYNDKKLTDDIKYYFRKEGNEYVVGAHKDGNSERDGYHRYAGSLVFPLYGVSDENNYSKVQWYADHPNAEEYNIRTGTWCKNAEVLEKVAETNMIQDQPIILRTDVWHGIRFSSSPRVLMRWLFKHDLTWNEISNLFD